MPLQKLLFKPGVNRENTRYTNEGGYYDCDKIRFRQGTPEKIGGWTQLSSTTFVGLCRSLWSWATLSLRILLGVGTSKKFYIQTGGGGNYYDVTPIRAQATLTDPFSTVNGSPTVTVCASTHGASTGDYVTFYSASSVGGLSLNNEYTITVIDADSYTITAASNATSTVVYPPGGGGTVSAVYQVSVGTDVTTPLFGWGSGSWGEGAWGVGGSSSDSLRIWNQTNFGQDLIYGPRKGVPYYWNASTGYDYSSITVTVGSPAVVSSSVVLDDTTAVTLTTTGSLPTGLVAGVVYYVVNSTGTTFNLAATSGGTPITTTGTQSGDHFFSARGIPLASLSGASMVPLSQLYILVSDASRYVIFFGTTAENDTTLDPVLIRWSDAGFPALWDPNATNPAGDASTSGSIRLSHGSKIVTAIQSRQEILVITDSSIYSMQYVGPPYIWGIQLLGDNISIAGPNAATLASGVTYWMGVDKFYVYDGRVQTLNCDLRQYVFDGTTGINKAEFDQVYCSTNEGFNEVWWFYCGGTSNVVTNYVVYNYVENVWYYGTMGRTAWIDSGLNNYPIAATYNNVLVNHESGNDDNATGTPAPIDSFITTSEFDIQDGNEFGFVWRVVPDLRFTGSTAANPQVTMSLLPLANSGSGYNNPLSVGGTNSASIVRTVAFPVEQYTGQILTRVRGRQMSLKIQGNQLGLQWQLGAPRIDIRKDGRR
jgi:hypothetical protein